MSTEEISRLRSAAWGSVTIVAMLLIGYAIA